MAHVHHTTPTQESFLLELEQRQRLDEAWLKAAALLEHIRKLRNSPDSITLTDDLQETASKVGQVVEEYKSALLESRRKQVEFEFGGRS